MSQVFSSHGARALRPAWILLALSIAAAAAIGAGGTWFLERAKREGASTQQRVREANARLDTVRRERDNLAESAEVFRDLAERGILGGERRLDMIEMVSGLRKRYQLSALDYEIAPQRPLPNASFGAVDVLSSRVKLRMRALHEGDILGLLESLAQAPRGLYPIERCMMRRLDEGAVNQPLHARVEAECTLHWITLKEKRRDGRPG